MEVKKNVGIDWLQVSGKVFDLELLNDIRKYSQVKRTYGKDLILLFNKSEKGTKDFRTLVNIQYIDQSTGEFSDFAVLTADWVLKKDNGEDLQILKIYNHILYWLEPEQLNNMIECFFQVNKISRIDFYCDFQNFETGKNPEKFIREVANLKYLYKDQRTQITLDRHGQNYNGLTLGKRTSIVRTYLYNKTLEINQKSKKTYISELHKETFKNDATVWRLEFSCLRPNELIFENELTNGEFTLKRTHLIEIYKNIYEIVNSLLCRFWVWKKNAKRRENQTKIKDTYFFDFSKNIKYNLRCSRIVRVPEEQKTAKTTLKMMLKLNDELRKRRVQELPKDAIFYFIDKYQLNEYLKKLDYQVNIKPPRNWVPNEYEQGLTR